MIKKANEKGVAIIGPATVSHTPFLCVDHLTALDYTCRLVESNLDVSRLETLEE